MLASDSDLPLRPEGLAKERNGARLRLRPASPTRRPSQGGTALASDSNPPLRPKGHRTSAYSSSPTNAVGDDWETTERGRPLGKDPEN